MLADRIADLLERITYATAMTVGKEWDGVREAIVAGVRDLEERVDVLESIHAEQPPAAVAAVAEAKPAEQPGNGPVQSNIDRRSREYRKSIGRTGAA